MNSHPTLGRAAAILTVAWLAPVFAAEPIFEVSEIPTRGRVVAAHFADFDGDGRKDLMTATLDGVPPREHRALQVYPAQDDGGFSTEPGHSVGIPEWSAVYDVADLMETPGDELVLLRPDGLTIMSLAGPGGARRDLTVSGPSTVAAGDDERGFEPFRIVHEGLGEQPWLLVPQIGVVSALAPDGEQLAQMEVGRRANYYVTRSTGLVAVESEIQLFLDVPKLTVADVNGDGAADVVAATRHELRVFLRDSEGGLPRRASHTLPLGLIDEVDHSRGSGSIVSTVRDIDDDGLADLMVSHISGSFFDTVTTTHVYLNRDGRWDLERPDDSYVSDGVFSSDLLLDVDGDNVLELVRIQLRFSVLEMVEFLLTREFDVNIGIHRLEEGGRYGAKPWARKKVSTAMSFDTFRPKGFMPRGGFDLNADGFMDFVTSAEGNGIEVYLGSAKGPFPRRPLRQKLDSTGNVLFDDYDGDGLLDFVMFSPRSKGAPLRIGRNMGRPPQ